MGDTVENITPPVSIPQSAARASGVSLKPVWVVDDDRSIRWVFEKALAREGIAFQTFALAQDALDALASGVPQVLVSDIRMNGASGLELLQKVKQQHPALPGSGARNPGFDVTPPELITGIITPMGVFKPKELWRNREALSGGQ